MAARAHADPGNIHQSPARRGSRDPICLALQAELEGSICIHCPPVLFTGRLAIGANGIWFVWLIKCLKIEQIYPPIKQATDASFPVARSILGRCDGGSVVGATSGWPASFCELISAKRLLGYGGHTAIHEVRAIETATDFLNVTHSLSYIIEVRLGSVVDGLVLPIRKDIAKPAGKSAKFTPS